MDQKRGQLLAALFVLGGIGTDASFAEVRIQQRTEFFDIGYVSGDPEQVRNGFRHNGPLVKGRLAWGVTSSKGVSLTKSVQPIGSGCAIKSADVSMSLVVTLPAWSWRNTAAPEQQAHWDCVERMVEVHENRHVEIWRETLHRIDKAVNDMTSAVPCGELNGRVQAVFDRLIAESRVRQAAFDIDDQKRRLYDQCRAPATGPTAVVTPNTALQPGPSSMAIGVRAEGAPATVAEPQTVVSPLMSDDVFAGPISTVVIIVLAGLSAAAFALAALRYVTGKA
jgi:predicted secreted Zn-dependent protease